MEGTHLLKLRAVINSFVAMSDEDWELIVPDISYRKIKKGDNWIAEGKKETHVGFILTGNMRHFYTREGEEKTTYFYFEDHLTCSYFSALTNTPSKLTIQALSSCELLVFPYSSLTALFDCSSAWERFGRKLAEYLVIGLEDRMVDLLILSPEERYGQMIGAKKSKIMEKIPQHYIANYLGISPVSLSRIRSRIFSKGKC